MNAEYALSQALWPDGPLGIQNDIAPCQLHASHTPITIINELHHIFPEFLQRRVWGKTVDQRKISICSTGHSSVHYAIDTYLRLGTWPSNIVGKTRDLAQLAIERYEASLLSVDKDAG